jgi:predicted nucleic acid-binding protein
MIIFVPDACAIARIYFEDIGSRNILQVYNYPDSLLVVPNFAHCEAISAMISALNNRDINAQQYVVAKAGLAYDFNIGKIQDLIVRNDLVKLGNQLLQKHKMQVGKMGLSGADSLYLAVAVKLASATKQHGVRVILVTSDNALYRSAIDEQEIETFHSWTCNLGCGCTSIIPV